MGKRINVRNAVRNDGRLFYKLKLPNDRIDIAVAVLNDESGSMSSRDRITYARSASIILHDFCKGLDIPVAIYGHTEEDDVELYAYAEFDSIDNKDHYRLMDMSARCGNRDGAALRYVAERLMTRPEAIKLLIIISDGQPAATIITVRRQRQTCAGSKRNMPPKASKYLPPPSVTTRKTSRGSIRTVFWTSPVWSGSL